MKLSRWLPLAIFLALGLLLAAGVWMSRNPDREALPSPLIGKRAPDFALPSLHEPQRTVTLRQLRGQPFVLNVWASWCVECRVEHPVLTRFAETRRVRVVGYDWQDQRADALRWLEQFGNPFWVVVADADGKAAIDWGVSGAPEGGGSQFAPRRWGAGRGPPPPRPPSTGACPARRKPSSWTATA